MPLFRTMKITHKLSAVTGILLLGLGGLTVSFFAMERLEQAMEAKNVLFEQLTDTTERIHFELFSSESFLKDFLLDEDNLAALEKFTSTAADATKEVAALAKLAQNNQQSQIIAQLADAIKAYQQAGKTASDAIIAVGISEKSGFRSEAVKTALTLEQSLRQAQEQDKGKTVDYAVLDSLQLNMRRLEKIFLLRLQDVEVERFGESKKRFEGIVAASAMPAEMKAQVSQGVQAYHAAFLRMVEGLKQREQAIAGVHQKDSQVETLTASLRKIMQETIDADRQHEAQQVRQKNIIFLSVLGVVSAFIVGTMVLLMVSLSRSLRRLSGTVQEVTGGNLEARSRMGQGDELATLGNAFDTLLDERVATMAATERERAVRLQEAQQENEGLNDSVLNLLQAVAQLSQRDLTVKVPVAEDVTGPVSDALNMLTEETSRVLMDVTRISESVATASRQVKVQSDSVSKLAGTEREQVTHSAEQLSEAAEAMNTIAELARSCNLVAENAINKTQTALESVSSTAEGINVIRDTIRETEKRIKRLGERSQEISGAVNLINGIAERTHILALNASMHAASAGEAGRGFAVVADEVQRLAESARASTEEIARLVSNIQTETMDTVSTMNTVISQVVEGSRLAGQAGDQMRQTQQTTAELVASVRQIATGAQAQAKVSNTLRDRAGEIVQSTLKTSEQLTAQDAQTTRLLEYASRLVRTVRVFKLPTQPAAPSSAMDHDGEPDTMLAEAGRA